MRASVDRQRVALFALLVLAACGPAYAAAFAAPELMRLLASVESSKARFVETRRSALLKTPLIQRGTLAYTRPDRLEKIVQTPHAETIVVQGGRLTIDNATRNRRTSIDIGAAPALAALVESIRATRAGDLAALERHYAVSVGGGREQWTLLLRPSGTQLAEYVRKVIVSGSAARIARIEVDEASGDLTVMELVEDVR